MLHRWGLNLSWQQWIHKEGVPTGVVRKYTPIVYWMSDDKMKFSASYGDDAWDSKSYLNIWICNMKDVMGYSTFPGMDPLKDGVVIIS